MYNWLIPPRGVPLGNLPRFSRPFPFATVVIPSRFRASSPAKKCILIEFLLVRGDVSIYNNPIQSQNQIQSFIRSSYSHPACFYYRTMDRIDMNLQRPPIYAESEIGAYNINIIKYRIELWLPFLKVNGNGVISGPMTASSFYFFGLWFDKHMPHLWQRKLLLILLIFICLFDDFNLFVWMANKSWTELFIALIWDSWWLEGEVYWIVIVLSIWQRSPVPKIQMKVKYSIIKRLLCK